MLKLSFLLVVSLVAAQNVRAKEVAACTEVSIPAGIYVPFFSSKTPNGSRFVSAFKMDTCPVSNLDFVDFLRKHPEWQRSRVPRVFAENSYLRHFKSDLELVDAFEKTRPVTHVSWFAANAYCESKQKRLPTTDEWEYAADDAGRKPDEIKKLILSWYGKPNSPRLPSVGTGYVNGYGLRDLFGLIWEWTLDFNDLMTSSETRNSDAKDNNLFCGAGSLGALDASDYAKFMRYSLRTSLQAEFTTANLGFRCARGVK